MRRQRRPTVNARGRALGLVDEKTWASLRRNAVKSNMRWLAKCTMLNPNHEPNSLLKAAGIAKIKRPSSVEEVCGVLGFTE